MEFSIFSFPLSADNEFTIALVSFESHRTYEDVASFLYEKRQELQAINGIILRPPVYRQIKTIITKEEDYKHVINRFPSIPVYLLYTFEYEIILSENLNKKSLEGLALPQSTTNSDIQTLAHTFALDNYETLLSVKLNKLKELFQPLSDSIQKEHNILDIRTICQIVTSKPCSYMAYL